MLGDEGQLDSVLVGYWRRNCLTLYVQIKDNYTFWNRIPNKKISFSNSD